MQIFIKQLKQMDSGREAHFHGTCVCGKTQLGQKGVVRVVQERSSEQQKAMD